MNNAYTRIYQRDANACYTTGERNIARNNLKYRVCVLTFNYLLKFVKEYKRNVGRIEEDKTASGASFACFYLVYASATGDCLSRSTAITTTFLPILSILSIYSPFMMWKSICRCRKRKLTSHPSCVYLSIYTSFLISLLSLISLRKWLTIRLNWKIILMSKWT